jgi:purine-nucleoside phosphorylase
MTDTHAHGTPASARPWEAAAAAVRARGGGDAAVGLVLGSGLGGLADQVEAAVSIAYADIPGMPVSTVAGHAGRLVIGTLEGVRVVCQQGRAHFYEGYTLAQVVFAVRLMHALGVHTLLLTNAAGGVNTAYHVGDVMVMQDHINFPGMTGHNVLMGPNDDTLGPRFPSLTRVYDRALRDHALGAARAAGVPVHQGVYAGLSGPTYETPAEIRFLRAVGADAVGMSTVHEAIAARHIGMRVFAMSGITNRCIDDPDSEQDTNHAEVMEAGHLLVPRMTVLVRAVLGLLAG